MKTLEITIVNGSTKFERVINVEKFSDMNNILGTTLNDFFRLVDMQANGNVKLFSFNKPFDLIVKTEAITIDTTKIASSLKTKFKLNKTAKRKRSFAKNVHAVIDWVTTPTVEKTIEEVITELND